MFIARAISSALLMTFALSGFATDQSQFVGRWCSSPCAYGVPSRPRNLPCGIDITTSEIRWVTEQRKHSRSYRVIEKLEFGEVFEVDGGGRRWFDDTVPGSQHRILLSTKHDIRRANVVRLSNPEYPDGDWWMMYIIRSDACP